MVPKVAAITMSFNELDLLPIWAAHYGRQVGPDHCYVVDHGSTQSSGLPIGTNAMRIPRSPHDDAKRASFISSLATSLLNYYQWVIYTDVDELVLADPDRYSSLPSYCASLNCDTITTIGFDVQQVPSLEPDLNTGLPIGSQRGWARFTSAMCKPVLTRKPVNWAPGFHSADVPCSFGDLYLFHLHWADSVIGRERLAKTRSMPWKNGPHGAHQRISDAQWTATFAGMAALPRVVLPVFSPESTAIAGWLDRVQAGVHYHAGQVAEADLSINAPELWAIPPRFRARL